MTNQAPACIYNAHHVVYCVSERGACGHRTTPLRLDTGKSYNFLAVYAWNDRKGWDLLLRSYWEEFTKDDDVWCDHH